MEPRSKKAIVLLVIVSGVVVVVAAGFALKRPITEQWYLWQLESHDEQERKIAAEKLGEIGSGRAVRRLLQVLRTPDVGFLLLPLAVLGLPPSDGISERFSPGIVTELFQYEIGNRGWNEFLLGKAIASIGVQGIPKVAAAIEDEDWQFGGDLAFDALLRKMIDAMGPGAVPYLVAMTKSENPNTRRLAVLTLRKHDHDSSRIIEVLSNTLQDEDHRIRILSAWSIGELGSVARVAMPNLKAALEDEHEWVCVAAREAIAKIAGSPK